MYLLFLILMLLIITMKVLWTINTCSIFYKITQKNTKYYLFDQHLVESGIKFYIKNTTTVLVNYYLTKQ